MISYQKGYVVEKIFNLIVITFGSPELIAKVRGKSVLLYKSFCNTSQLIPSAAIRLFVSWTVCVRMGIATDRRNEDTIPAVRDSPIRTL